MNEEKLDLILVTVMEIKAILNNQTLIKSKLENETDRPEIELELMQLTSQEVRELHEEIVGLENMIMLEQAEKIQDRVKVRQLEARVTKLEEQVGLAV